MLAALHRTPNLREIWLEESLPFLMAWKPWIIVSIQSLYKDTLYKNMGGGERRRKRKGGETYGNSNLESGISRCFHGPKNWYNCSIPFGLNVEPSLGENSSCDFASGRCCRYCDDVSPLRMLTYL